MSASCYRDCDRATLTFPAIGESGYESPSNHDKAARDDGQLPAAVVREVWNNEEADDGADVEAVGVASARASSRPGSDV